MRISILTSLWFFLRCLLMSSSAFLLLSPGRTKVQPLLGIYPKQPPSRNGPFSSLHTDIRDGPTCQMGWKGQRYWRTGTYKRGLESPKAAVLAELASSQERRTGLHVHWPCLFMVQVPWISLSALCFMEEQPALVAPPTFQYEAQRLFCSFCLNFKMGNSTDRLSGPSYKW